MRWGARTFKRCSRHKAGGLTPRGRLTQRAILWRNTDHLHEARPAAWSGFAVQFNLAPAEIARNKPRQQRLPRFALRATPWAQVTLAVPTAKISACSSPGYWGVR